MSKHQATKYRLISTDDLEAMLSMVLNVANGIAVNGSGIAIVKSVGLTEYGIEFRTRGVDRYAGLIQNFCVSLEMCSDPHAKTTAMMTARAIEKNYEEAIEAGHDKGVPI